MTSREAERASRASKLPLTKTYELTQCPTVLRRYNMAEVVFSGVSDHTSVQGNLFQGVKFWLSQKVPQRSRFINDIKVSVTNGDHTELELLTLCQANGGEVLPIEKHADVKIVDHARKEALPGTYAALSVRAVVLG